MEEVSGSHAPGTGWPRSLAAGLVVLVLDGTGIRASPAPSSRPLAAGEVIEAALRVGESHEYRARFAAGRCFVLAVAQVGIDVSVEVLPPGSESGQNHDGRASGSEFVVGLSPASGEHRVRIRAAGSKAPPGRYELVARELQGSDASQDACRRHVEAQALAAEGDERTEQAREEFRRVAEVWSTLGERALAAYVEHEIARLSLRLGEPATARSAATAAASIFGELGRTADRAYSLLWVGRALDTQGDYRSSAAIRREVIPLESALTPPDRAELHFGLGQAILELGEFDAALEELEQARAAFHELGMDSELTARVAIASAHIMRRDPLRALDELTSGLEDSRARNRPDMEARFLQRLGNVYWDLGDEAAAARNWRLALEFHQAAGNRIGEAAVLLQLGDHMARHGELSEAEASYRRALELLREAGSKQGESRALTRLGNVFAERGDTAAATEIQRRALEIIRSLGNVQSEIVALLNLGRTRRAAGDREEARTLLTSALELTRGGGKGIAESQLVAELARMDLESGRTERALTMLEAAIRKVEAEQDRALVPSLRATQTSEAQPLYTARTDLLMARHRAAPGEGWDMRALESAEGARGRALLSLLAEGEVDLTRGVDTDLWERYRVLQQRLATSTDARETTEITATIHVVEAEIRRRSPAYASLAHPVPITADEIRTRVLDPDTILLEIALGDERSWLWALGASELVSIALPPRDQIEKLARRTYEELSRPSAGASAAAPERAARDLSHLLLGPIASRLSGPWRGKRLAIVSSGALDYIPFAALPIGSGRLIDHHEIVRLPSATVLDALRRSPRHAGSGDRLVALIGDPVFAADDSRVQPGPAGARSGPGTTDPLALTALAAGGDLPRLPFSGREVRAIAALVEEQALVATGFGASRKLLLEGAVDRHRIVHIATHGLLNTTHPELSGLVLSLVDEHGAPREGFVRLQDVYDLRLAADLVVLSGCRTAIGREIDGEGFIGLARGFLHAGARRVVASSWKVDDDATAALMVVFYRGMLQESLTPSAALRAAQREIARTPRWSRSYYWAGFSLVGDWR